MPKYEVSLYSSGNASRIVEAKGEAEAINKVKKMLLDADGVTPKKNALLAFTWDFPHCFTSGGRLEDEYE